MHSNKIFLAQGIKQVWLELLKFTIPSARSLHLGRVYQVKTQPLANYPGSTPIVLSVTVFSGSRSRAEMPDLFSSHSPSSSSFLFDHRLFNLQARTRLSAIALISTSAPSSFEKVVETNHRHCCSFYASKFRLRYKAKSKSFFRFSVSS